MDGSDGFLVVIFGLLLLLPQVKTLATKTNIPYECEMERMMMMMMMRGEKKRGRVCPYLSIYLTPSIHPYHVRINAFYAF